LTATIFLLIDVLALFPGALLAAFQSKEKCRAPKNPPSLKLRRASPASDRGKLYAVAEVRTAFVGAGAASAACAATFANASG